MKPVAPLPVSLKPSRRLLLIQSLAHVAAAAAVLAASLPSWLAAALLVLAGASLARQRRPRLPVETLILCGDGRLQTVGADGAAGEAAVHPHTLVLPFLVVLLYRQEGRLRSLTLLADSLAAEDFRQLRLWLRWRSGAVDPA